MATTLRTFDFTAPSEITFADKRTYPWAEWFNGDIWQITAGEDFDTHPLMMERIIRTRAVSHKAKVRLRHQSVDGRSPFGIIVFQRKDVVGPAEQKKADAREKRAAKKLAAEAEAQEFLAQTQAKPVNGSKAPTKTATKAPAKVAPAKTVAKRTRPAPAAVVTPITTPSKRPSKRPAKLSA